MPASWPGKYITLRFSKSFILFRSCRRSRRFCLRSTWALLGNSKWNLSLGDRLFYRNLPPHKKKGATYAYVHICKNKLFTKLCFAAIFFPDHPSEFSSPVLEFFFSSTGQVSKFIMRKSAKFILLARFFASSSSSASCCAVPFSFVDFWKIFVYF